MFFNSEKTAELKAEGKGKQAMAANSEAWGAAGEEEKAPYVKMAAEDEQRFQKQTAEFAKKGWFTMGDGSKSTDAKNAHLIKKKSKKRKADGDTKEASASAKPKKTGEKKSKAAEGTTAKQRGRASTKGGGSASESKSGVRSKSKTET